MASRLFAMRLCNSSSSSTKCAILGSQSFITAANHNNPFGTTNKQTTRSASYESMSKLAASNLSARPAITSAISNNNRLLTRSPFLSFALMPKRRSISSSNSNSGNSMQADGEMSQFLSREIERERQTLKERGSALHPNLRDWQIEKDGAVVTLRRSAGDENLLVRLNVNNSVGQDYNDEDEVGEGEDERDGRSGRQPPGGGENSDEKLLSRPAFEVEIKRGSNTLAFNCVINDTVSQMFDSMATGGGQNAAGKGRGDSSRGAGGGDAQPPNEFVDLFDIEELAIFEGEEMKEETYVVSGDVMDGDMYEHVMNMLDDRGIGPEFTVELVKLATQYEQEQYVKLLEKLNQFVGDSSSAQSQSASGSGGGGSGRRER